MIFGVLNPEKIWHQQLGHLPTSPVYCIRFLGHSVLRLCNVQQLQRALLVCGILIWRLLSLPKSKTSDELSDSNKTTNSDNNVCSHPWRHTVTNGCYALSDRSVWFQWASTLSGRDCISSLSPPPPITVPSSLVTLLWDWVTDCPLQSTANPSQLSCPAFCATAIDRGSQEDSNNRSIDASFY